MRFRSNPRGGPSADGERQAEMEESGSGKSHLGRLLALAVGLVAVAYLVSRYLDREGDDTVEGARDRAPSLEVVRDRASDAVAGEFQQIPIGDSDERDAPEDETDEVAAGETSDDELVDDAETNVDVTAEERSPEEIEERASEERAEPGEMAIDDDVADVVDGEATAESEKSSVESEEELTEQADDDEET
ncbi:hypothetical protein AB7C87_10675 [Natrarchaeobius sp. A-rgal3]|uniref:hypothetical protein n=1 Tax=Natrarchaeobius versutus TaxID=1679078 RepID=UPI00351087BA